MDPKTRKRVRQWAVLVIGVDEVDRFLSLPFDDIGFGYDVYGGERESALAAYAVGLMLYRQYFQVSSFGIENVPAKGRVILASNRAGFLPFDSLMAFVDVVVNHPPSRFLRIPAGLSLARLPYMGLLLQRIGQVVNNRRNLELALEREEALFMSSEKKKGAMDFLLKKKDISPFLSTFIELCLTLHTPVVPVAFFSSEASLPFLGNVKFLADKFRLSHLPTGLSLPLLGFLRALPLPMKVGIRYGEPISFFEEYPAETIEHPNLVAQMAEVVRERVQEMVDEGL